MWFVRLAAVKHEGCSLPYGTLQRSRVTGLFRTPCLLDSYVRVLRVTLAKVKPSRHRYKTQSQVCQDCRASDSLPCAHEILP